MNAKIEIIDERRKHEELGTLIAQISDLENEITGRDITSGGNNWIGSQQDKAQWNTKTDHLRQQLDILKQNYSLTLLTWAKEFA